MSIEIRRLRHVVEVARAESITVAAHTLNITQSALTKSIADVEARIGIELFQRLPRGVRLTDAGRNFVVKARRILGDVDDLMTGIADYRDLNAGRLRLGIAPAAYQKFIADPLIAMAAAYPGIAIEMLTGSTEELAPQLMGGELDLIVGAARPLQKWPDFTVETLADFYCVFMLRKEHPLAAKANVEEADVLRCPAIIPATVEPVHSDLAQIYARNGLPPLTPHYTCDNFEMIRRIVAATDAFSPVINLDPGFGTLRRDFLLLDDVVDMPTQRIAVAASGNRPLIPAAEELIRRLRERVKQRHS